MINDINHKYNYDLCDYRVSSFAFAKSMTIYLHVKYENCYLSQSVQYMSSLYPSNIN